jgi:hypothetical protein
MRTSSHPSLSIKELVFSIYDQLKDNYWKRGVILDAILYLYIGVLDVARY